MLYLIGKRYTVLYSYSDEIRDHHCAAIAISLLDNVYMKVSCSFNSY